MANKRGAKSGGKATAPSGRGSVTPSGSVVDRRDLLLCLGLVLVVLTAYANHFQNDFHFDDSHTIVRNLNIRDLRNIPHFFTDGSMFSVNPLNATYRPMTSVSLAIDYPTLLATMVETALARGVGLR